MKPDKHERAAESSVAGMRTEKCLIACGFRSVFYTEARSGIPPSLASLRIVLTRPGLEGEHESLSRPATHSHRQDAHFCPRNSESLRPRKLFSPGARRCPGHKSH